jgi:RNA polymerase sigma factor (sigma-70 family)
VISESESLPVLARYDGQRPLVPWLIRVFQNWHISRLRRHTGTQPIPEDDIALPLPVREETRWHEMFCEAARAWLGGLDDSEIMLLGLRLRYRMSQREVAVLLKVHEGTISRRTDALRDQCLADISKQMLGQGWTGEDLSELIRTEMHSLLLDDPRLSVDNLARILAQQGRKLPGA